MSDSEYTAYCERIPAALEQIPKGAFLVGEGSDNPITIGWATFGFIWGRPVIEVLVRKSRYTHQFMESGATFTISVPKQGTFVSELALCGTKSGRDIDKIAAAKLTTKPARVGGASAIAGCESYFECRVLYRQDMALERMDDATRERCYGANQVGTDGDPHTMYFGEVIAAY